MDAPDLLLLELRTVDADRSPELRYLASDLLARARRVFDRVEPVAWLEGSPEPVLPDARAVLVVGRENVFLTETSLARMRDALASSADLVVPHLLNAFDLAGDEPVFTLRAYERLEHRIFAERREPWHPATSSLPVALYDGAFFRRQVASRSVGDLVTVGLGESEWGRAVHDGIFHVYIDYYGEVREDILPFLPRDAEGVLEVGCGRGHTGALIEERLDCRVTGVELNPEIAADASTRISRVLVGDILELDLDDRYDAIVATELFEHLTDPERFLAQARRALRPGGRIVLSVPNVGHHSIVEDLLAGRWDYLPIGLLCYTHYRFFTRATLASWVERLGFSDYEIVPQTTDLPDRFRALPEPFEVDLDSLATQGFYVILRP